MSSLRALVARLLNVVLPRRGEQRLSEEIAAHLEALADEFEQRGMSRRDAELAARRAFGNVDSVRQQHRDGRGFASLDAWWQDVRFATRMLVRDRWLAAAAIVALSLGIGVTTAAFSIVNGMNLSQLPVPDQHQVVAVSSLDPRSGRSGGVSMAEFEDLRSSLSTLWGPGAWLGASMNLGDANRPADRLPGAFVSADTFAVLRVMPVIGRSFAADDDRPGAAPVALISFAIWRNRYHQDPSVVGRPVRINGAVVTLVGVLPDGFHFPLQGDVWMPLATATDLDRTRRDVRMLSLVARLRDGVRLDAAHAELTARFATFATTYPVSNANLTATVTPFTERFVGRISDPPPLLILSASLLVLLIACGNAANLLLARGATRLREMALRTAMGASRGRLVRQLLVESTMLAIAAGAVGLLLSRAGVALFVAETREANLPFWMHFGINWRVLAFVATASGLTGVLFGLVPALQLGGSRGSDALKSVSANLGGQRRRRRLTGALLVAQVTMTLVMLIAATLLFRTASTLAAADAAVDMTNAVTARVTLPMPAALVAERRAATLATLQDRFDAEPEIESAAVVSTLPFLGAPTRTVILDDDASGERPRAAQVVAISDRYFETLRVAVTNGRTLQPSDHLLGNEGVVVNERFVAQHLNGGGAIGRRFRLRQTADAAGPGRLVTIVGVSANVRQSQNGEVEPVVYMPLALEPPGGAALIARARRADAPMGDVLRRHAHAVDPDLAIYGVTPLPRISALSRWIPRSMSAVLVITGFISLVLATVGLYAMTAFGVAERTAELGLRKALGASRAAVSWLVLRDAMRRLALGTVLGLAGGIAVSRVLGSVTTAVATDDPRAFIAAVVMLATVTLIACLLPARRAARLDPSAALRRE